ncbi:non-ribosomal peptide synthetase [Pseudoduganella armeniaca]|uniref:Carrier domain-containing protein n=1 Tax=Pseudoduganella armeniaca TaxID=2072590 RepID=A0A2R4CGZ7_9BURK|nr:non-ribosomal peptide synthetase [Pseudoduganella armeniaca]AVR98931.1 hypothetical protein C9I28_27390 [Pseudoduganella armeniaca]
MTELPLSIAQQGLWFLSHVEASANAAYNMIFALRATQALRPEVLRAALLLMARRHAVLRAAVHAADGIPRLAIAETVAEADIPLRQEMGQLEAIATHASGIPFDMATQPLYRVVLVESEGTTAGLVFVFHHVIFDDASARIFFQELQVAYDSLARGQTPDFGAAPADLSHITEHEAAFIASAAGRAALEDTVQRLRGMPARLALPGKRGAADERLVYPAAMVSVAIPAPLGEAVQAASSRLRATPAAIYLAAFQALLWKYSGQRDFGISLPVSHRVTPELARMLGYLVNLGIVRFRLGPERSIAQLIGDAGDQLFDVLDVAGIPFPLVTKQLKRSGEDIQGPLLQVGFNYLKDEAVGYRLGDCDLTPMEIAPVFAKNELKLDIQDNKRLCLLYDRAGFEPAFMEQMARHYLVLLEAALAAPDTRLRDLPLLSAAERQRVLVDWNATPAPLPQQQPALLHQMFEAQARATPDVPAVLCDDTVLTYAALDARANQLAHHLRALGVGPDTLVALCTERSVEMVVGMLGVLKAGAAYVPLDPDYPPQRLAFMLDDTAAPVLLTQQRLLAQLPPHRARTLCLDSEWEHIAAAPATAPDNVTLPQHLAYCIYTSGSTGGPKGAINTHQGVANLLRWYTSPPLAMASGERIVLASSLSFDLTQKNILGTLSAGATLVVPAGPTADAALFQAALARHRPTRVNCAPSAYRALMEGCTDNPLRTVVLGGEPIDHVLMAELASRDIDLVNSYGPTECADVALYCLRHPDASGDGIALGRPLPDVQVYLLDQALQPVPVGVTGEIHIAGIGLARGYLNRPDLTAERFIPNPHGAPGSRMYRTGDLGRYLPDGSIEFLGRIDHQVKIRGFRIELGEIEGALLRCPGVREAAVLARADGGEEKRLVAYLVVQPGATLEPAALHAQLLQSLPAYMVPSAWVTLEAMPLNPNGKIDRFALPAPACAAAPVDTYVAPETATEQLLATIWSDVLNQPRIGIHDNFFLLGGHSLLATQVMARLLGEQGVAVPLRTLFNAPTIAAFARQVDQLRSNRASAPAMPAIRRQARKSLSA